MDKIKNSKRGRWLSLLIAFAMIVTSGPLAMWISADEVYADTIKVKLSVDSTEHIYGGSGVSHVFTVTVNSKKRPAYCLQPHLEAPASGNRKAAEMSDSSKVSQTMYYCYGYPGQKKTATWLKKNGYTSYAKGLELYHLSHVVLSYAYDSDHAFIGWSNGSASTTISASYQTMVKKTYAYIKSLPDPAGFDSSISFKSTSGATANASWTKDGQFKSDTITLKGHEDNYVKYKVPSDMSLVTKGKTYAAGKTVTIYGDQSFYLTTDNFKRANTTYSSGDLKGNLYDYTAYKITDSGTQNLAFFAVDKPDTAAFTVKFGNVDIDLGTKAQDKNTKSNQGTATPDAVFTDTVSYANVTPGKSYTIKGKLMDKATGKAISINGKEVTSSKTFKADKSSGTVVLEYKFDVSLLKGKTTVVFEDIYYDGIKLASHADLKDEGQTLYYPDVKTKAKDLKTEINQGITERDDVLIDEVSYSNVIVGKEYTVKGKLMNKETGKPILVDGKEITSEVKFKAEATSGTVRMKFILDSRMLKGKTTVVFEDLYQGTVKVAAHADIEDEGQSVKYPEIKTTAKDAETGINEAAIRKETKIIDTVEYNNLIVGKEYTLKGKLMDKATGKPYLANGKEVTAETTFKAEKESGTVDMEFIFDSTGMEGKSVVVFERLIMDGVKVTTHADIEDEGQTIHFPKIRTKAKDGVTDNNTGTLEKSATIIDTVSYSNLVPGKEYTIKGKLMLKETGKALRINGKEVSSETTFTPQKANGTVEIKFAFDSRKLKGKTVVVFENLYHKGIELTCHADIKDKDQSINYPAPKPKPKKPAPPVNTPQTGDSDNMLIWILIAGAAALVIGGIILKKKKQ